MLKRLIDVITFYIFEIIIMAVFKIKPEGTLLIFTKGLNLTTYYEQEFSLVGVKKTYLSGIQIDLVEYTGSWY